MSIIIETKNLTKKFGDFIANNNINIQVEKQEIKCIVGENGAGKSTLMNMLYGVHKPTSGKILLNGKEVAIEYFKCCYRTDKFKFYIYQAR